MANARHALRDANSLNIIQQFGSFQPLNSPNKTNCQEPLTVCAKSRFRIQWVQQFPSGTCKPMQCPVFSPTIQAFCVNPAKYQAATATSPNSLLTLAAPRLEGTCGRSAPWEPGKSEARIIWICSYLRSALPTKVSCL